MIASASSVPTQVHAFIAVPIPTLQGGQIRAAQDELRRAMSAVAWTRPEALHVTLRFLGNIAGSRLDALSRALVPAIAAVPQFDLALGNLGTFAQRVIWVGVEQGRAELAALALAVRSAAAGFGSHEDERAFQPHVTIGRIGGGRRLPVELPELPPLHGTPWPVREINLIRSDLSSVGARYTTLARFPLALA